MVSKKKVALKGYRGFLSGISELLTKARRSAARNVNSILTATYWEIGRRIVEFEQKGKASAAYGENIMTSLAEDLTARFGRGFSKSNLFQMRSFYLAYRKKFQTVSGILGDFDFKGIIKILPLSWSQYVKLLSVEDESARNFYETEATRGGWSVRQLDRQINTQFYERTLLSRNKAAMLKKGQIPRKDEVPSPDEEIKNPTVLEFLNLKDEYSESEIEDVLIHRLEDFLLELGSGFAFVARQKRLRIGDVWYRIDLVLYHRKLRCLVLIDLKAGNFTHADAGQMNLYLNYAKERMTLPDENPPVGIILCAGHNDTVVHYALGGLKNKVLATQYKLQLPDENRIKAEFKRVQQELKREK